MRWTLMVVSATCRMHSLQQTLAPPNHQFDTSKMLGVGRAARRRKEDAEAVCQVCWTRESQNSVECARENGGCANGCSRTVQAMLECSKSGWTYCWIMS